jgi:hypothetical protein
VAVAVPAGLRSATTATDRARMESGPAEQRSYVVSRERLLLSLALPFVLLLAASLASWPWRSFGLPGGVGTLTPPGAVLLALTVVASVFALNKKLPLGMITWVPAGQGAIVLLTTGFAASIDDVFAGIAVIIAYVLIYFIVLGIAIVISSAGTSIGITFVCFFVFTQSARFPVFEVDASADFAWPGALTLLAVARATAEIALMVWLARRLVEGTDESARNVALAIVVLTFAHGLFAAWEDPLLRGELSIAEATRQMFRWFVLVAIQLAMAFGLMRLRYSWSFDQWQQGPPIPEVEMPETAAEPIEPRAAPHRGGRPTPRAHRRR